MGQGLNFKRYKKDDCFDRLCRTAKRLDEKPLLALSTEALLYLPKQLLRLLSFGKIQLPSMGFTRGSQTLYDLLSFMIQSKRYHEVRLLNQFILQNLKNRQQLTEKQKVAEFLDILYFLFEEIQADDAYKKQFKKYIHAFARAHQLPCKIANLHAHAYHQLANQTHEVQAQAQRLEEKLKQRLYSKTQAQAYKKLLKERQQTRQKLLELQGQKRREIEKQRALDEKNHHAGEYAKALGQLHQKYQQTRQDYLPQHLQAYGLSLNGQPTNAKPSRYQVIWELDQHDRQCLNHQRTLFEGKTQYQMSENAWTVSIHSEEEKARLRRYKKYFIAAAFIFALFVCFGEAMVPFTITASISVFIFSFLVNYPMFNSAMRYALPEIFLNKLYEDERGNPVKPAKKRLIQCTIIVCFLAALGYGALALMATSNYFNPFISALVPGALGVGSVFPVVLGIVIGVSALVALTALFYVSFGRAVRRGLFGAVKNYLKARFLDEKSPIKLLINGFKLLLTIAISLLSTAIVVVFFTSQVLLFFMNPIKGVSFLSKTPALIAASVVSALAGVPNLTFVIEKAVIMCDMLVDGLINGIVTLFKAVCHPQQQGRELLQGIKQFISENPYYMVKRLISWVKIAVIGIYATYKNSVEGQSYVFVADNMVQENLIQPSAEITHINEGLTSAIWQINAASYSGFPLFYDVKLMYSLPKNSQEGKQQVTNSVDVKKNNATAKKFSHALSHSPIFLRHVNGIKGGAKTTLKYENFTLHTQTP